MITLKREIGYSLSCVIGPLLAAQLATGVADPGQIYPTELSDELNEVLAA